ncbi:YbbR-like domain-containing protein [Neobacillus sp. MM2021_6]|uniref:CdaR family protein n=1 Tax=Bacillaceae TaxID=186817 RepID=UPI00140C3E50|nr:MULTISPECIES: CdaR family protein [Bacillaceae]MBO0962445.1 YbbR-like domain-containing protein [Neobacillus sp. MM2021_6]NHC21232.1 YbbR-like domain-containing protein [Bacillus sp. MM2020_4]
MDKLMDNPWFIKILALLLAVLFYFSVAPTDKKFSDVNVPGKQTTETIKAMPVKVYYDVNNLVVTGIPRTADITIKGPVSHVQSAKTLKNFEVYVDLTNAKIGKQKVKLKVKDLSDKLKATLKPASVNVTVQEKITKEFKVEAEMNSGQIEDGYSAGAPIIEPKKVKVTGAKDVIDQITYVKATIDEKSKLSETTTKEARIQVLDKVLNKLNVIVEPETVKVTIPIKSNSKTVPINVVNKGTSPAGVTIESIELDEKEATIMGNEEVLKNTESVRVEVDLSKISENTTLTLPVIISNGITKVTPQTVKATVVVKKQEEKTVSGVPLKVRGLPDKYKAEITDPASQTVNLVVNGPSNSVTGLRQEDFTVFIDLTGLVEGIHDVKIQVEGPSNINWKPDKSSAKITITNNA